MLKFQVWNIQHQERETVSFPCQLFNCFLKIHLCRPCIPCCSIKAFMASQKSNTVYAFSSVNQGFTKCVPQNVGSNTVQMGMISIFFDDSLNRSGRNSPSQLADEQRARFIPSYLQPVGQSTSYRNIQRDHPLLVSFACYGNRPASLFNHYIVCI